MAEQIELYVFFAFMLFLAVSLYHALTPRLSASRAKRRAGAHVPPTPPELDSRWVLVGREFGLERGLGELRGQVDGWSVTLARARPRDEHDGHVRLTIEGALPPTLEAAPGGGGTTGDRAFDEVVATGESSHELVLALGHKARDAVRAAVANGWKLAGGLSIELPEWGNVVFAERLREGLAAATALVDAAGAGDAGDAASDLTARLVQRVADDAVVAVRRKALHVVLARTDDHQIRWAALGFALRDPDEALRFEAAELAPDWNVMRELAASGHAAALRALVARARAADVRELLPGWLARDLASAPEAALALAFALGQVPMPEGEAALCRLVGHADEGVQVEAARALGQVGTVAAVAALMPLRDRLLGGESKRAAREAIAAIQARAGGAAGAVTLAEGAAGAVALAAEVEREEA